MTISVRPILLRKRKLATIATFIFLIFSVISGYVVEYVVIQFEFNMPIYNVLFFKGFTMHADIG